MSLAHHFATMATNNAWANLRLLNACAQLTDEEFQAPRTSFFPSLSATLNHNYTVDLYYVDALERWFEGRSPNPDGVAFFATEVPFPYCAPLLAAQREVDRRLMTICAGLPDARLSQAVGVGRRTGIVFETATRLLAHLFQHQIHHRGQAHAMLAGTRIKPPQLDDFFCAGDAQARAPELAALGLTDAEIWNSQGT